jgi:hypothetical protein
VILGCVGTGVPLGALQHVLLGFPGRFAVQRIMVSEYSKDMLALLEVFVSVWFPERATRGAGIIATYTRHSELREDLKWQIETTRAVVVLSLDGPSCIDSTFANEDGLRLHGPCSSVTFMVHEHLCVVNSLVGPQNMLSLTEFTRLTHLADHEEFRAMYGPIRYCDGSPAGKASRVRTICTGPTIPEILPVRHPPLWAGRDRMGVAVASRRWPAPVALEWLGNLGPQDKQRLVSVHGGVLYPPVLRTYVPKVLVPMFLQGDLPRPGLCTITASLSSGAC